ncbi:hypothetical protein niasHT_014563 [Heterodera trifolii]|uniref:B30.2/SPRY domain-containing protein n=1 Tax=Heterodera trifolii TaxID=157864 RepID=A0ABD2LHT3_9BILA
MMPSLVTPMMTKRWQKICKMVGMPKPGTRTSKSLLAKYSFPKGWYSVYATQPILLTNGGCSENYYFEISIGKMEGSLTFGFANKKQRKLFTKYKHHQNAGIYGYEKNGDLYNGTFSIIGGNLKYAYGVDDVVGVGVNLASQQIIFTKNGQHLASLLAHNFADSSDSFLYPFVSLTKSGDEIEANFGPTFKFDLATLN